MKYKPHPKQIEFFERTTDVIFTSSYVHGSAKGAITREVIKKFMEQKTMMTGTIKNVLAGKNFGFIRDNEGVEYFFHREEFNGHWEDLIDDMANSSKKIRVEFEPTSTPKGARATNVSRLDFPNQGR